MANRPYMLVYFRTLYKSLPFGTCAIYFDLRVSILIFRSKQISSNPWEEMMNFVPLKSKWTGCVYTVKKISIYNKMGIVLRGSGYLVTGYM